MRWLHVAAVTLGALILAGTLLLIGLHLSQPGPCGRGAMPCSSAPTCIPQRSWCNGHRDCPSGEDEDSVGCADWAGSDGVLHTVLDALPPSKTRTTPTLRKCALTNFPVSCRCEDTKLNCRGAGLVEPPASIRGGVSKLVLLNNFIKKVDSSSFSDYPSLALLHLGGNSITHIPAGTFTGKKYLQKLLLMNNMLRRWDSSPGELQDLQRLQWLFLDNNQLEDRTWPLGQLGALGHLEWLSITNNKLRLMQNEEFPLMTSLHELNLTNNAVSRIEEMTFARLSRLTLLELSSNDVRSIHPAAFEKLLELKELRLANNKLSILPDHIFESLGSLTKLDLGGNPIHIPGHLFLPLQNLTSLGLQDIDIGNIDVDMFSVLPKLSNVYFKFYYYCSFVPHVPRCKPNNDGVSSMEHLLHALPLRLTVWLVAGFTLGANVLVMSGRAALNDDNRVLSLVIRSLAAADLLMGVYLVVIASADEVMRGQYNSYAHAWMTSWACTLAGVLSMVSSEVSVMTLVFMSLDRFLLIADPLGRNLMSFRSSARAVAAIWVSCVILAVLPVAVHWRSSTRFYGANGMCFPLHIDDPYLTGWQYSTFIFLCVNGASLLLVALLYLGMFLSIVRTRRATPLAVGDVDVAKRFFFIVLTDACCWAPIAVMKVLALAHVHISAELYAWVVVFLVPINSAINPVLYTLTIPKYRQVLARLARRLAVCDAVLSTRRPSADTESSRASHSHRVQTASGVTLRTPADRPSPGSRKTSASTMADGNLGLPGLSAGTLFGDQSGPPLPVHVCEGYC
ncbi:relaxin receptor 2-like isoform X2 [Frankliniella occidentalis]|uniref:Relaxin receptor 2-like isoform X2 n=1 Tax=Frankliniella occidentalis TaxID=133901 RepID=A0A9C6WWF6_FRAOC|nr:relaxin receptor 2-like isoform X2 [Frankliniella occidentalis]